MPRERTAKSWCFTWNNYPADYKERITIATTELEIDQGLQLVYAVAGEEVGASGTPHLQGFIAFSKAITRPSQRLWQSHWTVATHPVNAALYCKKGEQTHEEWTRHKHNGPNYGTHAVVWESGTPPSKRGAQGKRTDLHTLREAIQTAFDNDEIYTEADARNDFPDVAAKYPRFVQLSIHDYKPRVTVDPHPLREWQQELNATLNRPANDRDVYFVVDLYGNAGKTWFAKYYRQNHDNVQLIPPGKYADMAFIVNEATRVFFVDTPREKVEYFNYYFLEKLKDRDLFSPKWYSIHKEWQHRCHVVVLMNHEPDMDKLSDDRYHIIRPQRVLRGEEGT